MREFESFVSARSTWLTPSGASVDGLFLRVVFTTSGYLLTAVLSAPALGGPTAGTGLRPAPTVLLFNQDAVARASQPSSPELLPRSWASRGLLLRPPLRLSMMDTTGVASVPGEGSVQSLARHVTDQHACSAVDGSTRSLFVPTPLVVASGGLAHESATAENPPRPDPFRGSHHRGPPSAQRDGSETLDVDQTTPSTPTLVVERPLLVLLAGNTMLHVLQRCRLRMINVVAQCWSVVAPGRDVLGSYCPPCLLAFARRTRSAGVSLFGRNTGLKNCGSWRSSRC